MTKDLRPVWRIGRNKDISKLVEENSKSQLKLLLLVYYWPPSSSVACHRWLFMSKHLLDLGHDITVIIPLNPDYPIVDNELEKFVDKRIKVVKRPIFEVRKIFKKRKNTQQVDNLFYKEKKDQSLLEKISLWIRANVFIPDARVSWYYQTRHFLNSFIKSSGIDVVISSGPPHTTHLMAGYAKEQTGVKWIADFRDPWTAIEYFPTLPLTNIAKERHLTLEKKAISEPDAVVTVSPSWAEDLERIGGRKVNVIYNGFEADVKMPASVYKSECLTIYHIGTLNKDRNPEVLWNLLQEFQSDGQKIEINLVGNISEYIRKDIKERKIEGLVNLVGNVSHASSLRKMKEADILLLLINKDKGNQKGRIPAKIFEYFQSRKKILCIGDTLGDAASMIEKHKAGYVFSYKDEARLRLTLSELLDRKKKNLVGETTFDVNQYSRKSMALEYHKLIAKIT